MTGSGTLVQVRNLGMGDPRSRRLRQPAPPA